MKIKDGYNSEEMEIRIDTQSNGTINLWITIQGKETLSYMTPDELHKLFQEVQLAGKDLFN